MNSLKFQLVACLTVPFYLRDHIPDNYTRFVKGHDGMVELPKLVDTVISRKQFSSTNLIVLTSFLIAVREATLTT